MTTDKVIQALPVKNVFVIGLGLIGGSFARAIKKADPSLHIIGYDRNQSEMEAALRLGVIDEVASDLVYGAEKAHLIMLSVPVKAMNKVLREVRDHISDQTIITDVGSVKGAVIDAVADAFGFLPRCFVPGHPIAGSEKSGVEASNGDLFVKHKVIITPPSGVSSKAVNSVRNLWSKTGADVLAMSPRRHDEVLASTSHLPHLLAFSLVDTMAREDQSLDIFRYAAGGFRDFTRIAASDPTMWHDIFLTNTNALMGSLDHFEAGVKRVREAILNQDSREMLGIFTRAKAAREHFNRILDGTPYLKPMSSKNIEFHVKPGGSVNGSIRVPGDKSVSHRSIMLGALSKGITEVSGFLEGEDALATLQAFRDMGVVIEGPYDGEVKIYGVGLHGLQAPPGPIYVGNSGTSMRLLCGLLAGQEFDVTLTGDDSLSKRPMERVAKPLREMGAVIETGEGGRPPVKIKGGQKLKGIHYDLPMASAQVKSCVLLAGLYADGETSTTEPAPTRDHTERMLNGFGYPVEQNGATASLKAGGSLTAAKIDVPSDISSAAFFMVAASIAPDSDLTIQHVGMNPTRVGVINILRAMGANIELSNEKEVGGEPVADVRVRSAQLKGIHIPEDQVPLAIDEFPALFIAAACAEGETVLTGAEELRVKESDRIQVMADGLIELGIDAKPTPDGMIIKGGEMGSATVHSHGDHRIAMSFAVAGLRAKGQIVIKDAVHVATSFPGFVELSSGVGMNIESQEV
ncbi:bifunctional prephenate dehydrogenase/3-phosphoshikimate 1-carboxyvinyltransferase [Litoribacillus peritrichatus]|uniref:3-phosphoshikimate 1-carboxyvinyltransferase n=1 Tax=Litoribacillus peritrichatus TaxID=718191 RepID=A0ABP7MCI6_9GAMM